MNRSAYIISAAYYEALSIFVGSGDLATLGLASQCPFIADDKDNSSVGFYLTGTIEH